MGATANYLAIDLGASSGRAALGSLENHRLTLREVHRFPNTPLELPTGLHWDAPRLFHEIKHAMALAVGSGVQLSGVGVDTWGVDYALLKQNGELLGPPHHYRDPRTHGMMGEAFRRMSRDAMYERTGLQDLPFNTLYQLLADQHAADHPLDRAESLLFMPDLFHYWLTGVRRTEHTIASTSQMYDPGSGTWADDVLKAMALPKRLLPSIAEPGTPVGALRSDIAGEVGGEVTVIGPAGHDTASAVAAIPAAGNDWAYISSGTWSLVGRELGGPLRSPEALAANFTNERGVAGKIRFHKNITGLWLLQECQREWAGQGRSNSFEHLCALALRAPSFAAFVDPDHPSFSEFGDMPSRIRDYCRRTLQPVPASEGELVRCILESLALKSRVAIDALESLTGPASLIHIVGGGSQSTLLCQFTCNALSRPVLAGPVEATAAGNVMVQALAHGRVSGLDHIRSIIRASQPPTPYSPKQSAEWGEAYRVFQDLLTRAHP